MDKFKTLEHKITDFQDFYDCFKISDNEAEIKEALNLLRNFRAYLNDGIDDLESALFKQSWLSCLEYAKYVDEE